MAAQPKFPLLPCPFCGNKACQPYVWPGAEADDCWDVGCSRCTARLQALKTAAEAAATWNRRVIATQ